MKVGTDGVLLGAWIDASLAMSILDIGTGSGLIAIMLAQKSSPETKIDAVEIAIEDSQQAKANVTDCPWPKKIKIYNKRIQDFAHEKKYDLIVSNPPFFNDSHLPPSHSRKTARHTQSLTYDELLSSVQRLLIDEGTFAVILPTKEGNLFVSLAQFHGLYCKKQVNVYSREGKPQERWLLAFSKTPQLVTSEKLTLYEGEQRSEAYGKLTFDFYL